MRLSVCICLVAASWGMREKVAEPRVVSPLTSEEEDEDAFTTDESEMESVSMSQAASPVQDDSHGGFFEEEEDIWEPSEELKDEIFAARQSVSEEKIFNETWALNYRKRDEVGSLVVAPRLIPTRSYRMRELEEEALQVTESKPHKVFNWMKLGKQLGKSATSAVFEISTLPGYVIKYQVNCDPENVFVDDVTTEYYYLTKLDGKGIAPRALYLSRGTRLTNPHDVFEFDSNGKVVGSKTRKLNMDFSSWEAGKTCVGGRVRYMVMEQVGSSIEKILEENPNGLSLHEALETGAQMIELIERLHKAGYVHRDVHSGNFARGVGEDKSLYLIDYGLSSHSNAITTDGIVSPWYERFDGPLMALFHSHLSPWEMQGYMSSYRDDFVRTLGLIGALIHGSASYEAGIADSIKISIDQAGMSMFGKKPHTKFAIMNRKLHESLSGHGSANAITRLGRICGFPNAAHYKLTKLVDALRVINQKLDKSVYAVPNYARVAKMLRETALVVRQCTE